MKKQQIEKIFEAFIKKLEKKFNKVIPNFELEAIHKFRVEYKKLKAFFRMVGRENKRKNKFNFSSKLKKAYQISGKIRDLQLQRLRILDETKANKEKPKQYINILEKAIDKSKIELFENYLKKPLTKIRKKAKKAIPRNYDLIDFKSYIQAQGILISKEIAIENLQDSNIHYIRKLLKDVFLNLKIIEKIPKQNTSEIGFNYNEQNYYFALLETLGHFQDLCVSVDLLNSKVAEKIAMPERKILAAIKKRWISKRSSLKRQIIKKLKA